MNNFKQAQPERARGHRSERIMIMVDTYGSRTVVLDKPTVGEKPPVKISDTVESHSRDNVKPVTKSNQPLATEADIHARRVLNFSEYESRHEEISEDTSLGLLRPEEEMSLANFLPSPKSSQSVDVTEGILTEREMNIDSLVGIGSLESDAFIKRIDSHIANRTALLHSAEILPKTPSIDRIIERCRKGTEMLNALKAKVKQLQQHPEPPTHSTPAEDARKDILQLIGESIECEEQLKELSSTVRQTITDQRMVEQCNQLSKTFDDSSNRLRSLEAKWRAIVQADENSSLGLLSESCLQTNRTFMQDASSSLEPSFQRVHQSIDDVQRDPTPTNLNSLRTAMKDCQSLLVAISNHQQSLLSQESAPAFAQSSTMDESLLEYIVQELDKTVATESEALAAAQDSPTRQEFLQQYRQAIDGTQVLKQKALLLVQSAKPKDTGASLRKNVLTKRLEEQKDRTVDGKHTEEPTSTSNEQDSQDRRVVFDADVSANVTSGTAGPQKVATTATPKQAAYSDSPYEYHEQTHYTIVVTEGDLDASDTEDPRQSEHADESRKATKSSMSMIRRDMNSIVKKLQEIQSKLQEPAAVIERSGGSSDRLGQPRDYADLVGKLTIKLQDVANQLV